MERLEIKEYAGQKCDVVIIKRDDNSICITFETEKGYGNPTLELESLKKLIKKCEVLGDDD